MPKNGVLGKTLEIFLKASSFQMDVDGKVSERVDGKSAQMNSFTIRHNYNPFCYMFRSNPFFMFASLQSRSKQ